MSRIAELWARARAAPAAVSAQFIRLTLIVWLARMWRAFERDHCLLRASALTYATLLAVVPLLAVVLALLKGAGFADSLRPFLLDRFPVVDVSVVDSLLAYIDRANAQAVGGIGFALLLVSAWNMLGNVESSLNEILGLPRGRGYLRRSGEYLAMLFIGSVVIVLSIVLQTVLESPALFRAVLGERLAGDAAGFGLTLLPWGMVWLGFTLLYSWMPNGHIPVRLALFGGLLGGTLFQLVQLGYIELQLGFGRYHAIYGALAQLPILLVWIYLSWCVALLGAEGIALVRVIGTKEEPRGLGGYEGLPLASLRAVLEAFLRGERTPSAAELGVRFGATAHQVRDAVEPFLRDGILVEPDGEHGYLPALAPSAISIERVLLGLAEAERSGETS